MPTTSPDSIYYADGTTPASLADITAAMATSVQNALNLREGHSFSWANSAGRSAQTGMAAGDIGYQIDTDVFYIYTGAAWVIWAKQPATYTPTFTNFTASSSAFVYSIASGMVNVQGKFTCAATLPTGSITFTTPSGYNINTTQLGTVQAAIIGTGGVDDASTTTDYLAGVRVVSSTSVALVGYNAAATASLTVSTSSATVPLTWASGDIAYVRFSYPVV